MKLIGSPASPYARKVRVVMAEKKLDYQYVIEDVWAPDSAITESNPLGKVPCLIMEAGEAVFDSRVIVEAQRSQPWIDRQLGKINAVLKAMSTGLADKPFCSGVHFSLSDVAVGCALGYLDYRFPQIAWRDTYPNLVKLQDKLAQRPSFMETAPK